MLEDLAFLKLCDVYEVACLRRDVMRCSGEREDEALLKSEEECKSLEAIAYIRERQKFSGIIGKAAPARRAGLLSETNRCACALTRSGTHFEISFRVFAQRLHDQLAKLARFGPGFSIGET